ncbi:androgen-induced gene 1 protein isoform 2-T2 [Acridotheres tristis]
MALVPSQVLHAAILLSYCSILCNYKAIDMPAHQTYGGSWKFLTFIDLVIQAVFFGICVLTDLSSLLTRGNDSQEQERQLKKLISLRDWMMAVLAFPVGVVRIPLLPPWKKKKKKIPFPIFLVPVIVLSLRVI